MKKGLRIVILLLLMLTGCTLNLAAPAGETPDAENVFPLPTASLAAGETTLPETEQEIGSEPAAEESLTPSPTQAPFEPFTASVWADHVNVRTQPGYLFPVLLQLNEGDQFTVNAKAPGDEWLFIELDDGSTGWVYIMLVKMEYDISLIPIRKPEEVQIITGQLLTPAGQPINGVQFMITQASTSGELRTDASTDQNGIFTAYLPPDAGGEWTVAYTAISCSSIVHDAACNTRPEYGGTANPLSQTVTLPDADMLQFVWK